MSLKPHEALYHVTFKLGQRSRGRSAVAASAYRAGARLLDERTGRTFDYRRKREVHSTLVIAPEDAPPWVYDRGELWSHAEMAERRQDAQVWREAEIALPRSLAAEQWRPLLEEIVGPYVHAGAVADIAIHTPTAIDGAAQPHAHVMLSLRELDGQTPTGFAARKNARLAAFFEGPGRRDGVRAERERIADVINWHLRAVGSHQRVDHRSYRDRADEREPEPRVGEMAAAWRRRDGSLSDRQRLVEVMRAQKSAWNEMFDINKEVVKENPMAAISPKAQAFKSRLLQERYPDLDIRHVVPDLGMVDVEHLDRTRIMLRNGTWVEAGQQAVRVWGRDPESARRLAEVLADAEGIAPEEVVFLPPCLRAEGKAADAANKAELRSLADHWRTAGYTDVTASPQGVWIGLGPSRLLDTGNRCEIHGGLTDDAIRALVDKAERDWNGSMDIFGSEEFKQKAWLEAQRRGVLIGNYEPPAWLRRRSEAEQRQQGMTAAAAARNEAKIATMPDVVRMARQVRDYAEGAQSTLGDRGIRSAIDAMTEEDRHELSTASTADIIQRLGDLRSTGRRLAGGKNVAGSREDTEPETQNADLTPNRGAK